MDIPVDKSKSGSKRPGPILAVMQAITGMVRWLVGFFTLTEENRLKAGIYVGGEGRD